MQMKSPGTTFLKSELNEGDGGGYIAIKVAILGATTNKKNAN